MDKPALDPRARIRYARHLSLPQVAEEGQLRLLRSSVAIVGTGGLGSPVAMYLAAAGVGRIRLLDEDRVEASNLQRQILFDAGDVGRDKVVAARDRLARMNDGVRIEAVAARVERSNADELLAGADVVIDGTDNLEARYAINDACVRLGVPHVFGSVFRFEGQVAVFWAGRGPCYRCLHPTEPQDGDLPDCATAGVLGVLPGIIGSLQALETIKLLLDGGSPLVGRLLLVDAWEMSFHEVGVPADPRCSTCGGDVGSPRTELGSSTDDLVEILPRDLRSRIDRGDGLVLLDVRSAMEREWARLPDHAWIPIDELPRRFRELDPGSEIVAYCHSGVRSAWVARYLMDHGFSRVAHLAGGIDAWSRFVDPEVPRY